MKANAQYNDFIGTSAADISDDYDLTKFLTARGVDTDRYQAIGAEFYSGYAQHFTASIICLDTEQSTTDKKHIVELSFEVEVTRDEFFNLFKRFNVIITNKYGGYPDQDIDEQITIDDRIED